MGVSNVTRKFLSENKGRSILGLGVAHGLSIWGATSDYKEARDKGYGQVHSLLNAGAEFAKGELLGWKYPLLQLAESAPAMIVGAAESAAKLQRSMNKESRQVPFQNAYFNDYSQAYTMRQAGMKIAQGSRYNLQQALMGNEAAYLNR